MGKGSRGNRQAKRRGRFKKDKGNRKEREGENEKGS
jgi:hypothetical protein